ncbi:hypothetical protein KM043_014439 [Ampulex compressa]|nr:hypothetical protein KM043_014439 [Ampulex compressa]
MSQGVGWVYRQRKDQLRAIAEKKGLVQEGTVEQFRNRLSQHLRMESGEKSTPATSAGPAAPAAPMLLSEPDPTAIDKVRCWGVHFDGREPKKFLESLEELHVSYRVSPDDALTCLSEVMIGSAQTWVGTNAGLSQPLHPLDQGRGAGRRNRAKSPAAGRTSPSLRRQHPSPHEENMKRSSKSLCPVPKPDKKTTLRQRPPLPATTGPPTAGAAGSAATSDTNDVARATFSAPTAEPRAKTGNDQPAGMEGDFRPSP